MTTERKYTRKEIAERNTKTDAVFVIENLVYDVTKFLDDHPGGHEVLLNAAGKDATEDFEDIAHSLDAKELMKKYLVGELVEADRVERQQRHMQWGEAGAERGGGSGAGFFSSWKFPVALGLLTTLLYTYLFG